MAEIHELKGRVVEFAGSPWRLYQPFLPAGDQPEAIRLLTEGIADGLSFQTLLGVTGSGKTYTMANVIARSGRPALVLAPNKTLAAQLYGELQDTKKRQYWLQRMIDANASAGSQQNDRTKYLAASATNELADIPYKDFASLPLSLPIKQSLQRKRTALEKALKAQESVLSFGVAEFTTQASFRIGDIYAQLSRDLMKSERPKNLDADALEQYDLLLEEQAFPFEEKAIQIHQANAQRASKGIYDQWVRRSFEELAKLLPARYRKV